MSGYFFSVQANADMREIHDYIAADSPRAAARLIDVIEETCQFLTQSPQVGESREDLAHSLRCISVRRYVIFFRQAGRDVEIVRVLHGARDIQAQFHQSD